MRCRCCNSSNMTMVLDLGKQAWGNDFIPIKENRISDKYPLELCFCGDCTMVQIGYTVPKEVMFVDHAYLSGTTRSLRGHFESVARDIISKIKFNKNDYIFDIGGNDGTFLEYFKHKGIDVLNIDSGKLQSQLSRKKGIPCVNDFFNESSAEKIKKAKGCAKVIHGSGILFHLEELHSAFKGIKNLLSDDGMLVAEFIYLPAMVRNCAYDQIYHEHLLYYTLMSFQELLYKAGLEIWDAYISGIHGGSCVANISHSGSKKKSHRMEGLLNEEKKCGYHKIETYLKFAEDAKKHRSEVLDIIGRLKSEKKSIQALGAPVKGSTIINYCNLTAEQIDCAVEINEYKCNTYYPGTKIPVYHQDSVNPPDVYLLLAWNFKDEILDKMKGYRDNNGKFLIPIPKPTLI